MDVLSLFKSTTSLASSLCAILFQAFLQLLSDQLQALIFIITTYVILLLAQLAELNQVHPLTLYRPDMTLQKRYCKKTEDELNFTK